MIEAYGASEVGPRHARNQDAVLVEPDLGLCVVADGMGGRSAGDVASRMTVGLVGRFVRATAESAEITWPYGIDARRSMNANRLITAVKLANRKVWKLADENQEYLGMGSTVVATLLDGTTLTICSAGDSRAYRLRNGTLERLTTDDSWAEMARAEGLTAEGTIEKHPMRNVITKAVGATEAIDPEVVEHTVEPGDVFLLCSDGLYRPVSEESMRASLVDAGSSVDGAVDVLMSHARNNGMRDDASAVVFRTPR